MKQRIHHFDLLKGIAIYLVVMGHVLTMCIRGLDAAFCFKLIGQVHMPVFFFISGYFTFKTSAGKSFASPNLKKRFLQLIVPLLCVVPLWVWYFPHSQLLSPLSDNLPDLLRAYWKDGYWFTLCLFELCLVYWLSSFALQRLRRTWMQVAMIVAVYAVLIVLSVAFADEEANVDYAGVGLMALFYPVFMTGVLARKLQSAFERVCHSSLWLTAALLTFALSFYCLVYPWDMPWGEHATVVTALQFTLMPLMHFSLIILAIAAVEPWSKREYAENRTPSAPARYFNLLGNESLGIYLLHYFFLFPLTMLQEPFKAMGLANVPMLATAMVVAFAVIALTLLVIHFIKLSRPLALLLLGKV